MKTPRYRIADRAEADMDDIWAYIAAHNPDAAEALMGNFRQRFASLARTPGIGRRRIDLRSDLRVSRWAIMSSSTVSFSQASRLSAFFTER